eukprot:NODE_2496_length_1407_cov_64.529595_g2374_i0.p1 GENE.NODE_2496_length_1407_cov_64.529595_g2374_i0~~NODE_2496_length_1407_cov_64.529595_g2374_i0.p1  ORF type:complete len:371 (-),score=47.52 NODE_2496_length_1407_cov_64.529595_g2374_i0:151-1263(-)
MEVHALLPPATPPPLPPPPVKLGWQALIGYMFVAGVVASWIFQAEVAQCLQKAGCLGVKEPFNKPYFMTWANHGWQALMLPLSAAIHRFKGHRTESWTFVMEEQYELTPSVLFIIGLKFAVCYFIADYFWYLALPLTSVAIATTIFNSSCVFVYILSVILLNEKVSIRKICAVALAVGGVVCIGMTAHSDGEAHHDNGSVLLGNMFALGSAVGYAVYEVLFSKFVVDKYRITDPNAINTLSAYIGFANILMIWIGIPLVTLLPSHWSILYESFRFPTGRAFWVLLLNGSLAFGFNVCLMLALAFTSPLITNLACTLCIPLSALVDYLWHGDQMTMGDIIGGALIALSFVLITVGDYLQHRGKHEEEAVLQ